MDKLNNYVFFLGGADAEMARIAEVLEKAGCEVRDAGLGWGAKASDYGEQEFAAVAKTGKIPVLIELAINCDLPETAVVIDPHNDRAADEAPAILQVLRLLGVEPTRWDYLVVANDDVGFSGLAGTLEIPGMGFLSPPATQEEIKMFYPDPPEDAYLFHMKEFHKMDKELEEAKRALREVCVEGQRIIRLLLKYA